MGIRRWLFGARRKRTVGVLLAAGAVAAAMVVVVPASGAEHELRLQVNSTTGAFQFKSGSTVQPVTLGAKGCEISPLSGPLVPLVTLSSNSGGGVKGPGLVGYGIGVKSGGSNGTPCSQVDAAEVLTLTSANGRVWKEVKLDLELKGNAWVKVTLSSSAGSRSYHLVTGSSIALAGLIPAPGSFPYTATSTQHDDPSTPGFEGIQQCANPSDSGPDSGPNDNCYWYIAPTDGFQFTKVDITTRIYGSASLEGGGDFIGTSFAGTRDSIFYYGNTPPVVGGSGSVDEDETATFTVATDVDSTALATSCTSSAGASITDIGDGSIQYTPALNFNGIDALSCTVSDGTSSVSDTFTVTVNAVNDPPVAVNDTAETDEIDVFGALVSVDIDVLANDTDVEDDPLTVGAVNLAGTLGTVANNGSDVTYTPQAGYVWADGQSTYVDTFRYRASDGAALSNEATVTVTVYRVICSGDTVRDSDGDVFGEFTRLTDRFDCKRFVIDADQGGGTVLFEPEGDTVVSYRGFLRFGATAGATSAGPATFSVGLEYDPDASDGLGDWQPLLACIDPVFDADGQVISATLPGDPDAETWCIASFYGEATTGGDYVITWQVYGEGDPGFRFG